MQASEFSIYYFSRTHRRRCALPLIVVKRHARKTVAKMGSMVYRKRATWISIPRWRQQQRLRNRSRRWMWGGL